MRLLVDTDAFCKLGIAGLLEEAVRVVGAELSKCVRLAALPYMLRKGSLPKRYGAKACEALIESAERMIPIAPVDQAKLQPFVAMTDIDPGEAQLLASVADSDSLLMSGDKRALRALKNSTDLVRALAGRVITLEAVLLAVAERVPIDELRRRASLMAPFDQTIKVCFSPGNDDPLSGLRSYLASLEADVHPLSLWKSKASES
jgi:hypothetical protein